MLSLSSHDSSTDVLSCMTKSEIRGLIKERLKSVDLAAESAAILQQLEPLIPTEGLVLAFEPLQDEPDIRPLAEALRLAGRLALVVGRGDDARVEPPGKIALALVPGRAFDPSGNRLGRGGGTFDRILSGLAAPKWGICFSCQVVERIPAEPHDVRVDRIVTAK
jgi:5-formyltetrahydrofolate cyclo-ligase